MGAQNHKTITSPAPIGGLNVKDSLAAMPPTDATVLVNFFPQPYGLELRQGTVKHAVVSALAVETLVPQIGSGIHAALFAFSGAGMYNATEAGISVVHAPVVSGLGSSRWDYVSMGNASGRNTVCFDGIDDPIWIHDWDTGSSTFPITRITYASGIPGAGQISGVDPKKIVGGTVHQRRIWMIEKDSTRAWYLAPEAITGEARLFDFGGVFTKGGYLIAMGSWTLDSGIGPDDLMVAMSSQGEIAIYSGADPSSVATWSLRGVWYTGAPLGRRCIQRVAGDLLILTQYGLLSLATAIQTGDTSEAVSSSYLSDKIAYLISQLASDLSEEFGWQVVNWPDTNMILVNVPLLGENGQLVQSTITKGWGQWDGIAAQCWTVFDHALVFGDDKGNIWRAWEGNTDGAEQVDDQTITEGQPIKGQCQTAFNYLGEHSTVKHAKMVRPTFMNAVKVPYAIKVNPDFEYERATAPGNAQSIAGDLWGKGKWDEAKWRGSVQTQKLWTAVSGIGAAFALTLAVNSSAPVLWATYDFMYENGTNI